jgi:hypothetical protein
MRHCEIRGLGREWGCMYVRGIHPSFFILVFCTHLFIFIHAVLLTMRTLLKEPNVDNPLEADIAQQLKNHPNDFAKTAKEWTKKYAK